VAGVAPFSDAVLCQTPCSVPAAVSNIYAVKESALRRYETPVDAEEEEEEEEEEDGDSQPPSLYSPSTCLGISWEPPCNHGSEITSYLIDLGERQPLVVGPVTKRIIQHLQPDTSYRSVLPHPTLNGSEMLRQACTTQLCTFQMSTRHNISNCWISGHKSHTHTTHCCFVPKGQHSLHVITFMNPGYSGQRLKPV